jgi:hypothetical protein
MSLSLLAGSCATTSEMKGPSNVDEAKAEVKKTVDGAFAALAKKDADAFGALFADSAESRSFGHPLTGANGVSGRAAIIDAAKRTFANINSIEVVPNNDLTIAFHAGNSAAIGVTGKNIVVDRAGARDEAAWHWTASLQKQPSGEWLITTDHLSFPTDKANFKLEEVDVRAACCKANVTVSVSMPKLNLEMTTDNPVLMYSRVKTIPPVGYTATVSVNSAALISKGRRVGTLDSAQVNFRETVAHVPVPWDSSRGRVVWNAKSRRFDMASANSR